MNYEHINNSVNWKCNIDYVEIVPEQKPISREEQETLLSFSPCDHFWCVDSSVRKDVKRFLKNQHFILTRAYANPKGDVIAIMGTLSEKSLYFYSKIRKVMDYQNLPQLFTKK